MDTRSTFESGRRDSVADCVLEEERTKKKIKKIIIGKKIATDHQLSIITWNGKEKEESKGGLELMRRRKTVAELKKKWKTIVS